MKNPARRVTCGFCAAGRDEVELLFVSEIGGYPPAICDRCVAVKYVVVAAHRTSPELAETLARITVPPDDGKDCPTFQPIKKPEERK